MGRGFVPKFGWSPTLNFIINSGTVSYTQIENLRQRNGEADLLVTSRKN